MGGKRDLFGRHRVGSQVPMEIGLMVNDVPIYRIDNMPFGGWKESGFGREGTRYAMEEMSDIKHLVINYA